MVSFILNLMDGSFEFGFSKLVEGLRRLHPLEATKVSLPDIEILR